ncbi:MAG: TVP38/TMEM64 family protein [Mariprofundaceae bacterium]
MSENNNHAARLSFKRLLPILILSAGAAAFFALDLGRYLSFSTLQENRVFLLDWVSTYPWISSLIYIGLYILVVTFSLPGGAVMTISGGFLFGAASGGFFAVAGATAGATILFLIAKTSIGDYLKKKAGPGIKKMQAGFTRNALSYLFVLRLVPVFPFFLVNLAPALLGVKLRVYLTATFFGIMPATFIFAMVGSGLGSVFDRGESFSVTSVLTPEVIAGLAGLALLALLPIVYKKIRAGKALNGEP